MRRITSLAAFLALALALATSATAQAQTQDRAGSRAPDYTEQSVGGDQVVKFTGDELSAPTNGAYGTTLRRPPGAVRVGLIRPRMNFVSELVKTVENL